MQNLRRAFFSALNRQEATPFRDPISFSTLVHNTVNNRRTAPALLVLAILSAQFFFPIELYSQQQKSKPPTASELIVRASNKLKTIKEFEADIRLHIELSYLKARDVDGRLFFRYPDQTKFTLKSGGMTPKLGIGLPFAKLLETKHTSIAIAQELVDTKQCSKIKIIPDDPADDVVLATLWIDIGTAVIRKMEVTTKKAGTVELKFQYSTEGEKRGLPATTVVFFEAPNFSLPKTLTGDFENDGPKEPPRKGPQKGTITITYSNYKFNTGWKDSAE